MLSDLGVPADRKAHTDAAKRATGGKETVAHTMVLMKNLKKKIMAAPLTIPAVASKVIKPVDWLRV